jgi:hypothetical protein
LHEPTVGIRRRTAATSRLPPRPFVLRPACRVMIDR